MVDPTKEPLMSEEQTVKVLSQNVSIVECDAAGWDTGSNGQWQGDHNDIKIKNHLAKPVGDLTRCHELTHAIEEFSGIVLTEEQVQAIGLGWYTIIMDNPEFIEYLWTEQNEAD
jgi:hypothetical protein